MDTRFHYIHNRLTLPHIVTPVNTQKITTWRLLYMKKSRHIRQTSGNWEEGAIMRWVFHFYSVALRKSRVKMQRRTVKTHRTFWIQKINDRAQGSQRSRAQNSEFSAQVYDPHVWGKLKQFSEEATKLNWYLSCYPLRKETVYNLTNLCCKTKPITLFREI